VGQDVPGDHGRQRMKLLADLEVAIKAVERPAEAIGEDIAAREQAEIQPAVQLDLPMVMGKRFPSCICKWLGWECRWCRKRRWVGKAGPPASRPIRGK